MTTAPPVTTFDVVVCTRNRQDALALSLPTVLSQSRRPERLIVVDSSDDHAATQRAVEAATKNAPVPVTLLHTAAGMTYQRNCGLMRATADVVMYPDDDSLSHPGAFAALMAPFDRDEGGQVAAAVAADAPEPPEGTLKGAAYAQGTMHAAATRRARFRHRVRFGVETFNPPLLIEGVIVGRAPALPWLEEVGAAQVGRVVGYRDMCFRAEPLRRVGGFEPAFVGAYALHEETDASFSVSRFGAVVTVPGARVYHHQFPSGRGRRGLFAAAGMLNLAYLSAKHIADLDLDRTEAGRVRRALRLQHLRQLARALAQGGRGRDEVRGLRAAWPEVRTLMRVPRGELRMAYAAGARRLGIYEATGEPPLPLDGTHLTTAMHHGERSPA